MFFGNPFGFALAVAGFAMAMATFVVGLRRKAWSPRHLAAWTLGGFLFGTGLAVWLVCGTVDDLCRPAWISFVALLTGGGFWWGGRSMDEVMKLGRGSSGEDPQGPRREGDGV